MVYKGELIGQNVLIHDLNSGCQWQGRIIDETKHTLCVTKLTKSLRVFKKNIELSLVDQKQTLKGVDLIRRPEERMKE
ncbi:ribonuclease P protein subunit [Candidatus Woesearchaeota archaeon]|nr:ribonuclease P protein subunit [Candidatus Woesearchaeota archaeon]